MYEEYEGRDRKGMILRIEKSSVYDGDGFRTVVFLKGCPLRCQWCSTPESQKGAPESTLDGSISYGKPMTVEEVLVEVRKDSLFYFHSGGGMTLSGGEILAQSGFVLALLRRCRYEAIDTAVETSLYADWETARPVLEAVDTAFVDLKIFDEERHLAFTGVSNRRILENLRRTRRGKTTILIAHRISTVESMDRIVLLEEGRVLAVDDTGTIHCEFDNGVSLGALWGIDIVRKID